MNSAVELIFKASLTQDHWAFVFEDLNKANFDSYTDGDFKSISLDTALYRLQYICKIDLDEKFNRTITRLKKSRNKIEHFHLNENGYQLESIIYNTLSFLIPFLNSEFRNIYDNLEFQQASNWLHKNENYLNARNNIISSLLKTNSSFRVDCPQCKQENTLDIDNEICLFCNYHSVMALTNFIKTHSDFETLSLPYKHYDLLKDCPKCFKNSLIISTEQHICKCLNCKEQFEKERFLECGSCNRVDYLNDNGEPENGEIIEGYFCFKCLFQDI
ncbi:hypothetical protein [Solibacillus daqui]|uniref:hypothetical protein n=1 Tax=Solibacillus daqui TaxID=2912187 RepID=UPI00236724DD|nr:hypothetical protein [Solibacillus daqui]